MPTMPLIGYLLPSSHRKKGLISLVAGQAEDRLSIQFEPRMGCKVSGASGDPDAKRRGNPSPPEEPGKNQGLFEAGRIDRGKARRHLHKPGQVGNRRESGVGGTARLPQGAFLPERQQMRKCQGAQGEFNK
jgi:hypothetical protein